jgi:hypothetical protein
LGAYDEGTLAALKAIRRELGDPKVKEHRRRIVKTTGDGLLLEYSNVVDAVRCPVEVQRQMAERNADVPPERRIEFRIEVNLGDVIRDGSDIFGDGSTLRPVWKRSRSRAGSTSAEWCTIRCATSSMSCSMISAISGTSPMRDT